MYPLLILAICLSGTFLGGAAAAGRDRASVLTCAVGPVVSLVLFPLSDALMLTIYFLGVATVGRALPELRDWFYLYPGADADADRKGLAATARVVRCTSHAHVCVLLVGFALGCV